MTRLTPARVRAGLVAQVQALSNRARAQLRDRPAIAASARAYRAGDALVQVPFRAERHDLPGVIEAGGVRIDTVDDLVAYTELPPEVVRDLLVARRPLNFRGEWWSTDPQMRSDHWFYLSSKAYLFGNAAHFPDGEFVERNVAPYVPAAAHILDFGGGSGGLALRLAADGHRVTVFELGAIQRDFLRFRVHRHGLDRVTVLDPWEPIDRDAFDAVLAVDVFEHLPDGRRVLEDTLLPALRLSGALVENSPFIVNTANPMHHEDWGLAETLRADGLELVATDPDDTRVWRRPQSPRTS